MQNMPMTGMDGVVVAQWCMVPLTVFRFLS